MIRQRDIVEVNFLFPDGKFLPHFAIVLSNNELIDNEGFLYLALISTKKHFNKYTYELMDNMVSKPLPKRSFVVCHIISGYTERDVVSKYAKVKDVYFQDILLKIQECIF